MFTRGMKAHAEAETPAARIAKGTLLAVAAYAMWGLFPIYWKQLGAVDALDILAQRVFWSLAFALGLLAARRRIGELLSLLRDPRRLMTVFVAGWLILGNWGVYIWAVGMGRIVESSLGYYLSPLLAVLFGAVFFHERIDRWFALSIAIAVLGVTYLAVSFGKVPWISIILALTWSCYGTVKKLAGLEPIAGIAAETTATLPFALWRLATSPGGAGLLGNGAAVSSLLVLAGPVTALPLLAYAGAANRIPLSRIGILQYFSPTTQLLLGVLVYGESFTSAHAVSFATLGTALAIYLGTRGLVAREAAGKNTNRRDAETPRRG